MSAMKSNRKYYYFSGFQTFFIVTHNKKYIMEQTHKNTLRHTTKTWFTKQYLPSSVNALCYFSVWLYSSLFYAIQLKRDVVGELLSLFQSPQFEKEI